MLDVRRLAVLAAAVREGSLAAGARSLGLTPGAASQAVAALEAGAGTALLQRLPRGVRPTPAGERLAAHAEAILATLHRAEAELTGPYGADVRLAAFPTAVFGLLPDTLARLRATAPQVRVHITELEPGPAQAALHRGECDIALVNHPTVLAPDPRGPWEIVALHDEPVHAALPPVHPLAHRDTVTVGDLATDPWITQMPASPCQQLLLRACADAGFAPTITATCSDYRSILALVAAHAGVSLVPELALHGLHAPPAALVPTHPTVQRRIAALVSRRPGTPPAAQLVLDTLRHTITALPTQTPDTHRPAASDVDVAIPNSAPL